ncbi:MAG TPA: hypothetical protein VFA78_03505, partial [Chloroflexota bacterium]|nr:hypothetical protein [Chloroflexota bacterium]
MRTKSDTQVLQEYDDLIDGNAATTRVLRALDAGYGSAPLPPSLRELKLPVRTAGKPSGVGGWRKRWKISAPIAVLGAVAIVVAGSLAAGKTPNITDLGKPTNDYGASGYNVLDNFHK